jgi:hypothetical protein
MWNSANIAVLLVAAALPVCASAAMTECPGAIYVVMNKQGDVQIDRKPVAIADVDRELARLRPAAHFVMYYRENAGVIPSGQASSNIHAVMDSVMKLGLPLTLSSKPDFSDTIDGQGDSYPRRHCED